MSDLCNEYCFDIMSFKNHITSLRCILLRLDNSCSLFIFVLENNCIKKQLNGNQANTFLMRILVCNVNIVLIFWHVHKLKQRAPVVPFANSIYEKTKMLCFTWKTMQCYHQWHAYIKYHSWIMQTRSKHYKNPYLHANINFVE